MDGSVRRCVVPGGAERHHPTAHMHHPDQPVGLGPEVRPRRHHAQGSGRRGVAAARHDVARTQQDPRRARGQLQQHVGRDRGYVHGGDDPQGSGSHPLPARELDRHEHALAAARVDGRVHPGGP